MNDWDYIIVGAGSAGCVLANRLSADPSARVLLIEAGAPDRSPYIHIPAAIIRAVGNPALDWCYMAEPDESRHGKVDLWPAGKTLGGSSSINGRLFVRGREGPMQVSRLRTTHPLAKIFIEAANECGIALNADYNGVVQEGAAEPQVTQRGGWRLSAARAFLHPILSRPNLRVETHCFCQKLVIESGRCVSVNTHRDGVYREHHARGEVIVAAGSLATPKLLMHSGIGPGAALRNFGISVVCDAPQVGNNLQEHCNSLVSADVNVRTYNMEARGMRAAGNLLHWLVTGRGSASSPYPHGVALVPSSAAEASPDLQSLFGPFAFGFDEHGIVPYGKPAVTIVAYACHPHARGSVWLRSTDPAAAPLISHAQLSDERDLRRQIAGCRIARQLLASRAFAAYVRAEFLPGADTQTDAEWATHVRRTSALGYHPVGTCRVGTDAAAVVTPQLKVRGVSALRIADASIMPQQIKANTNAATKMIAEKASDIVLAERRLARAA